MWPALFTGSWVCQAFAVDVYPGNAIQDAVDANPPGTTFFIHAGTYRNQTIWPKDNDIFTGEPGTVLSGAQQLQYFGPSGNTWYAWVPNPQGQTYGPCAAGHPGCAFPEDLFIDNQPLLRLTDPNALVPGSWYFNYDAQTIMFQLWDPADDPNHHVVEISLTRAAFESVPGTQAAGITIQNMMIEKYASPTQMGAIGDQFPGPGWIVQNCELRYNHGRGANLGINGQALYNNIHHNGEMGIGALSGSVLTGNEIAYNNLAGYDCNWECGGAKFAVIDGLTVQGNYVHDNFGPGLWTDIDSIHVTYDGNVVVNNQDSGIKHEISYDAKIINNVVRNNAVGVSGWLWGAQILVQNSQNVEVANNTVEISAQGGNGIGIIDQNRGTGAYGPYLAQNIWIHDNDITHDGPRGNDGAVTDWANENVFAANRFDYNNYHVPDVNLAYWYWMDASGQPFYNWNAFQAAGQERNGTINGMNSLESTAFVGTSNLSIPPATAVDSPNLQAVRAYPNPWRADRGYTVLHFDPVPAGSTIKLFTVSGHWIKTLHELNGTMSWDLTNDHGEKVASGIYLFLLYDTLGNYSRGKVAVIR